MIIGNHCLPLLLNHAFHSLPNSLKQGWKLFIIMVGHTLIDIPDDILEIEVVE